MRARLRLKSKKTTSHCTLEERINLRPFIRDPGYFLYVFPSQEEDRKEQPPAQTQTYNHRQSRHRETVSDSNRHRDTKIHEFYRHRVTIIHKHTDWHPDRYSQRQTGILSPNNTHTHTHMSTDKIRETCGQTHKFWDNQFADSDRMKIIPLQRFTIVKMLCD